VYLPESQDRDRSILSALVAANGINVTDLSDEASQNLRRMIAAETAA